MKITEKSLAAVVKKLREVFDKSLQKGLKEGLSKMSPLEIKEAFSPFGDNLTDTFNTDTDEGVSDDDN